MALLIRLIMALFTRPKIGLFHPTLTDILVYVKSLFTVSIKLLPINKYVKSSKICYSRLACLCFTGGSDDEAFLDEQSNRDIQE